VPRRNSDSLIAKSHGELTNFVCTSCFACWHVSLGAVYQVPTSPCPGCRLADVCRAARPVTVATSPKTGLTGFAPGAVALPPRPPRSPQGSAPTDPTGPAHSEVVAVVVTPRPPRRNLRGWVGARVSLALGVAARRGPASSCTSEPSRVLRRPRRGDVGPYPPYPPYRRGVRALVLQGAGLPCGGARPQSRTTAHG
jgi:hypothetical protein